MSQRAREPAEDVPPPLRRHQGLDGGDGRAGEGVEDDAGEQDSHRSPGTAPPYPAHQQEGHRHGAQEGEEARCPHPGDEARQSVHRLADEDHARGKCQRRAQRSGPPTPATTPARPPPASPTKTPPAPSASVAPRAPPPATPTTRGPATGLRSSAGSTAPVPASPAPPSRACSPRGSRSRKSSA